jgi:two-component system LytT family sensor kinase
MKRSGLPVIAIHLIGWILFLSLPVSFVLSQSDTSFGQLLASAAFWQFCIFFLLLFYLNEYVLLPKLLHRGHKLMYVAVLLGLLVAVFFLQPFEKLNHRTGGPRMENRMPPPDNLSPQPPSRGEYRQQRQGRGGFQRRGGPIRVDIISIFLFVMTIMFSLVVDTTRRWRLTEERAIRAEADKANAELSFLKAQINPHFLFNTLNNIYSMAVTRNENTAPMLMKLSNIMRYVTDVNEDYVSLQSEVDCISDYIDLQRLRLGKKVALQYSVAGNLENRKIAPLILMTFIENVFKYGVSNHEDSRLIIRISAEKNAVVFFTQNRIFPGARKDDRTGIGITNTEKRLQHLYPGKHKLDIRRENGIFTVELFLTD